MESDHKYLYVLIGSLILVIAITLTGYIDMNRIKDEDKIIIKKLNKEIESPKFSTSSSVGLDFYSSRDTIIAPKTFGRIPLGIVAKPPKDCFIFLRERSSTHKLGIIGIAGIIDPDYCGDKDELIFSVYNTLDKPVTIEKNTKICQGICVKYHTNPYLEFTDKTIKEDNRGGFGSTGN